MQFLPVLDYAAPLARRTSACSSKLSFRRLPPFSGSGSWAASLRSSGASATQRGSRGGPEGQRRAEGCRRGSGAGGGGPLCETPLLFELAGARVGRLVSLKGPLGGGASVSGRGRPPRRGPGARAPWRLHRSCVFAEPREGSAGCSGWSGVQVPALSLSSPGKDSQRQEVPFPLQQNENVSNAQVIQLCALCIMYVLAVCMYACIMYVLVYGCSVVSDSATPWLL